MFEHVENEFTLHSVHNELVFGDFAVALRVHGLQDVEHAGGQEVLDQPEHNVCCLSDVCTYVY